jgi:hypothetical protein
MVLEGVAAQWRDAIWKASESGLEAARSLPMKALLAFLSSIIAIKSDGDAGAILLREH